MNNSMNKPMNIYEKSLYFLSPQVIHRFIHRFLHSANLKQHIVNGCFWGYSHFTQLIRKNKIHKINIFFFSYLYFYLLGDFRAVFYQYQRVCSCPF